MKQQEWQKGNQSELTSIQRVVLHDEWLKQQHKEVREKIESKKIKKEEQLNVGFID